MFVLMVNLAKIQRFNGISTTVMCVKSITNGELNKRLFCRSIKHVTLK